MPPKIRELISDLERSGFIDRGGKGSHRNFVHPKVRNRSQYPVPPVMKQSITGFERFAARLRSQRHERQCAIREDC